MNSTWSSQPNTSFAALRRFVRAKPPLERCELCSAELRAQHQHLIEPATRKLVCACDPCAFLFGAQKQDGKYRRVPQRLRALPEFRLTDAQWESLLIPINMAFFFHSTPAGRVLVLYPSPAGATESLLPLESWAEIVRENPVLAELEPDVEALLVNRIGKTAQYYLAPMDECYKLVGLIRARWHGLSGGTEVWQEINHFFTELQERSLKSRDAARA